MRASDMRISTHPGQYTVLSSARPHNAAAPDVDAAVTWKHGDPSMR